MKKKQTQVGVLAIVGAVFLGVFRSAKHHHQQFDYTAFFISLGIVLGLYFLYRYLRTHHYLDGIFGEKPSESAPKEGAMSAKKDDVIFCPNCGKKLEPGTHFCDACGAKIVSAIQSRPFDQVKEVLQRIPVKKKQGIVVGVVCLALLLVGIGAFSSSDENIVKNGHFQVNTSRTVGESFDEFFRNGKWSSNVINGTHYVYFKADGCNATFVVDSKRETFRMTKLSVDGHEVSSDYGPIVNHIVNGDKQFRYSYDRND